MKKRPALQLLVLFAAFTVALATALWVLWREEDRRKERMLAPENNPPHEPVTPVVPAPDLPGAPQPPTGESPDAPPAPRAATVPDMEQAVLLARDAEAAMADQRYADAEDLALQSLAIFPESASTLRILAHVYICQGRAADAIPHLQHALRVEPLHPQALRDLSLAFFMQQNPVAALDVIETCLRVHPDDPAAVAQHGMILLSVPDRYPDAIDALTRASEIFPSNPGIRVNLATVYARMGRLDEAADILDAVNAGHPGNATALFNRAVVELLRGNRPGCIDGLRVALAAADPAERHALLGDPDLDPIRRTPEYRALLDEFDPTSSFRIDQGIP